MQVDLHHIHKAFGSVLANDGISLSIPPATIQGILGENGAGKSTLMKILSGFILPDAGEILLDGRPAPIRSPSEAIGWGIGMLHQDPLDFPPFSVLDDFTLGRPGAIFPDRKGAAKDLRALAAQFSFSIDPEAYVDTLTVGERQQLEILRLLWLGARVLILDEPTTGISLPQKERLFATLKRLAEQGMTIIFVSHKLEDVEFLCHRAAVLRQGKLVGQAAPPWSTRDLVSLMFEKEIPDNARTEPRLGRTILELKRVSLEGARVQVRDVDLQVRAGEVVGFAGMEGSGQSMLLSACAGLLRPVAGRIILKGRDATTDSYLRFRRQGIAYLPAARLEQGLVPGLSLAEHFMLSEGHTMFIDRRRAAEVARARIAAFNIKGSPATPVESLSGGNQQRMLLALLAESLSLVLLEQPTRGLDIESTLSIWSALKERCAEGAALLFVSSDLDEVLTYSDTVLVCFAGQVTPPLPARDLTVETLGALIGGKGWERFAAGAMRA
jgi:simple sugar transport system ATP-binding protein